MCYRWNNIRKSQKNKISSPTLNGRFESPDVSYSGSEIQDYFEYIIKKLESVSDNPSIIIYVKKQKVYSYLKLKLGIITNF